MVTALRTDDSLALVDSGDESLVNIDGAFELDNVLYLGAVDHLWLPREGLEVHTTTGYTTDKGSMRRDLGGLVQRDITTRQWYGRSDLTLLHGKHRIQGGVDAKVLQIAAEGEVEDWRAVPTWAAVPITDQGLDLLDLTDLGPTPEVSAYAQDTWEGPVRLRVGTRVSWTGFTEEVLVSPSFGASLPLPTATVPKVAGGIYYKTPRDPLIYDPDHGNPGIESERAAHLVVGVDQGVPLPGEEAGGLVRVEAYAISLDNLVVNPDTEAAVSRGESYTNDGSGWNRGIDVLVAGRSGRWGGMATYGLLFAERTNPLNEVHPQTIAPPQDQRHTALVGLNVTVGTRRGWPWNSRPRPAGGSRPATASTPVARCRRSPRPDQTTSSSPGSTTTASATTTPSIYGPSGDAPTAGRA